MFLAGLSEIRILVAPFIQFWVIVGFDNSNFYRYEFSLSLTHSNFPWRQKLCSRRPFEFLKIGFGSGLAHSNFSKSEFFSGAHIRIFTNINKFEFVLSTPLRQNSNFHPQSLHIRIFLLLILRVTPENDSQDSAKWLSLILNNDLAYSFCIFVSLHTTGSSKRYRRAVRGK